MRIRQPIIVTVSLVCLIGCGEVSKTTPPPPAAEAKTAEAAPPPPEPPAPLEPAPKAWAGLSFLSGGDPRCAGNTASSDTKLEQIEAQPLKIGLIPVTMSRTLVNQMTEKTRVWKIQSPGVDFYKILAGGKAGGSRSDRPSTACIRYTMSEDGAAPASEMIFSVTYNPKVPEVISIAPGRIHYRDFATLSAHSGSSQAVVKVGLSLKTYSLERNSGRLSASLQNEEMSVEIVTDPRTGGAIDLAYDPAAAPGPKIPLPPWDYSPAYESPRHNLSILELTVTEIPDFDWLQAQLTILWPSWEYEATDVSKLKHSAEFFSHTHWEKK